MTDRRHLSSSTRRVRESSALWQSLIISRLLDSADFSLFIFYLLEPLWTWWLDKEIPEIWD
jgi:hypothetical protein